MRRRLLTYLVLAFVFSVAAWSAAEPVSPFFGEEVVAAILESESDELLIQNFGLKPAEIKSIRWAIDSILSGKAMHREQGVLSPKGCFTYWPEHAERLYAKEEGLTTLAELVERAEEVLRVQVVSAEPGVIGPIFRTQVELNVLGVCANSSGSISKGSIISSMLLTLDIQLGDERICVDRPGFFIPAVGDEMLVLGKQLSGRLFGITNFFQIEDGSVQHQPYEFIDSSSDLRIDSLDGCVD